MDSLGPAAPGRIRAGRERYAAVVNKIRSDGWKVESYRFPLIADERRAGSASPQRPALADVATDREVWMLYSSFMRRIGPGLIWAYGPQAQAIGVGTTGGGPDIPGSPQMPTLSWEELERDLGLAWRWCDDMLIHSLEGCVWQNFLPRLRSFDWDAPVTPPWQTLPARGLRAALTASLWARGHPLPVLGAAGATATAGWLFARGRRG